MATLILPGLHSGIFKQIEEGLKPLLDAGIVPVAMGGDHSITLAELRAMAKNTGGGTGALRFHLDTWDQYWGQKYTHGTPFEEPVKKADRHGPFYPGWNPRIPVRSGRCAGLHQSGI